MNTQLFANWWLIAAKGLLAIIFGIVAIVIPGETILALTYIFGIMILMAGAAILLFAYQNRKTSKHSSSFVVEGIVDIIFGLLIMISPIFTAELFIAFIGGWTIVTGAFQVWFAIKHRSKEKGLGLVLFNSAINIIIGIVILLSPFIGLVMVSWTIGMGAIVVGLTLLYYAYEIKRYHLEIPENMITKL